MHELRDMREERRYHALDYLRQYCDNRLNDKREVFDERNEELYARVD